MFANIINENDDFYRWSYRVLGDQIYLTMDDDDPRVADPEVYLAVSHARPSRERLAAFQDATLRNLEHEIGVQQARIAISDARAGETSGDFDRKQRLRTGGYVAESDFDRTRYARVVTNNESELSRIELARLEDQLASARRGVFISDSRNDVPYSLQRVDEITIALADIATKRSEQVA